MKAVIFDLFETLITEWGRTKYTTRIIASDLNVDYDAFRREWVSLHGDRYAGKLSGTLNVLKKILHRLGVERNEELLAAVSSRRDACKRLCFESIEPSVMDMLSILKGNGYKIGLISNCSSEEIEGLKESALYPYFDAVTLSSDIGVTKPDMKVYRHCLNLIHENPSDCFYVGDGGRNELYGAQQAGMVPLKALWFIKHSADGYDSSSEYPVFFQTEDIIKHITCR